MIKMTNAGQCVWTERCVKAYSHDGMSLALVDGDRGYALDTQQSLDQGVPLVHTVQAIYLHGYSPGSHQLGRAAQRVTCRREVP